jgi:hypothetical protein
MAGDTVGAIYVKVIANTAGLKKQIEKEGKKSGAAFGREWDRAVAKEVNRGQFTDVVEKEMRASARRTAKQWAAQVGKGLKNQKVKFEIDQKALANMEDAAKRLGLKFEEEMDGVAFDPQVIAKYVREAMKEVDREAAKSEARRRKQYANYIQWQARTTRLLAKAQQASDAKAESDRRKGLLQTAAIRKRLERETQAEIAKAEKEALGLRQRQLNNFFANQRRDYKSVLALQKRIKVDVDTSGVDRFYARVKKIDLEMRNFSRRTGIWGTMLVSPFRALTATLKPVAGLVTAPLKALDALGRGMDTFGQKMMKSLGTGRMKSIFGPLSAGISMAGSSLSGLMKAMAKSPWTAVAAAIVAATVGLKLFNTAMGAMVALVSAAAGVLTMLGSALYAAAANVVLLVPMIGALGVGFAGLVVGALDAGKSISLLAKAMNETDPKKRAKLMKEYNRELKKLGPNARSAMTELAKLTEGFTDLKKEAGEALFKGMDKALKASTPMLDAMKKGLIGAAGAMGNLIDKFLKLGQDSVFVADLGTMFKGVKSIIDDLGSAFVDVFAGLTAFFSAIQPVVDLFTQAIADAAKSFRDWAQSEDGRKKIQDWFTKAYEIGGKVWAIIKEIGLAFHDLFTAGMNSPETATFLDSILVKVQDFRTLIQEAAEDGRLDQWFKDAKETAKALWDTIVLVGGALKSLNTEENRAFLNNLITGVGQLIDAFIKFSTIASIGFKAIWFLVGPIVRVFMNFVDLIYSGIKKVDELIQRFRDAKSQGESTFNAIKAAVKPFTDALKSAWDWVGKIITRVSQIKFPSIPSAFTKLGGKLFAAGGITTGPSIAGEAGPEMIIPLTRPLSQIDPSVRAIAAMLRGQGTDQVVTGGATGPTKIVNNEIKVYAPSADPEAVAAQVVNRSVAMAQ